MADNQVNIPLKLKLEHKQALEILKADFRKTIEYIKAEGRKSVADMQANNKLEIQESKNKTALKIASMRQETDAKRLELAKQVSEERKTAAELKRLTQEGKGKSVFIGDVGSVNYFKAQMSGYRDMMNQVKAGTPEFENYKQKVTETKDKIRELTSAQKGMSIFQKLEVGENITTIAAGIAGATAGIVMLGQKLYELGLQGAALANMRSYFEQMSGGASQAYNNLQLLSNAAAGAFDDRQLIQFANKMMALGYTVQDAARLMDISENASDNLGISIEEANNALLAFIQTGRGRGLFQFGIDLDAVNKKIQEMSGLTEKQIQSLDAETQERLRADAVMSLYGKTIDEINDKQRDNADQIESLSVMMTNFGNTIGQFVAPIVAGLVKTFQFLLESVGMVNRSVNDFSSTLLKSQKVSEDTKKILDELGISAQNMAEAYNNIASSIVTTTNTQVQSAKQFVTAEIAKIEALQEEARQLRFNQLIKIGDVATRTIQEQVNLWATAWDNAQGYTANLEKLRDLLGQLETRSKTLSDIEKAKNQTQTSNSKGSEKEAEIKTEINKLEQEITELLKEKAKYISDGNEGTKAYAKLLDDILEKEGKLARLKETYVPLNQKQINLNAGIIPSEMPGEVKPIDIPINPQAWENKKKVIKSFNDMITQSVLEMTKAFGDLFGAMMSGDTQDAFKNFMKSIVNTFITSIQAMLLASNAALVAKGITTFGISLITDAPLLAAGWIALEAARGIIGSFAQGGYVSGAGTSTSDSIPAMLSNGEFVVNAASTRSNLPLLSAINNNANFTPAMAAPVNNVYIGMDIDGVTFFRQTEKKYSRFKNQKRL